MTQTPAEDPVLASYRKSIDNIDAALVYMLAERFRITKAVGEHKAKTALPPADPGREQRQVARLRKLAEDADLDPASSSMKSSAITSRQRPANNLQRPLEGVTN